MKAQLPAAEVQPHAQMLVDRLLRGCPHFGPNMRGELAGSLRRGSALVGDVEIVLEPRFDADLFGSPLCTSAPLDLAIDECVKSGLLAWDQSVKRNGPRYKRLVICALNLPLDLFLTGPDNWGNILAYRTGDADFSRLLVTQRYKGGLLPNWMRCGDGRLYGRAADYPDYKEAPDVNEYTENVLSCPTEEAFFFWLWLPVPAMAQRTAAGVPDLRKEAVRRQQQAMSAEVQRVEAGKIEAGKEAVHV